MLPGYPASEQNCPAGAVRRHPRLLYSIPLTLHHLAMGGIRTSHGISLDISEGGVGALVEGSLQVGDTVALDVRLPESDLNLVAIVRHSSNLRSGFEFLGLTLEERQRLARLIAKA